MRLAVCQGLVG